MITVKAEMRINEGREDEAVAAIEKLVAAVSANEPGALMYTWHRGHDDPNEVLVYEIYENNEARKLHRAAPHFIEFQKAFAGGAFDPSSVKITAYDRIAALDR